LLIFGGKCSYCYCFGPFARLYFALSPGCFSGVARRRGVLAIWPFFAILQKSSFHPQKAVKNHQKHTYNTQLTLCWPVRGYNTHPIQPAETFTGKAFQRKCPNRAPCKNTKTMKLPK
jgi:hypothetical protein